MADAIPCPNCRHDVPPGRFCVRCGHPLAEGGPAEPRRAFAAAPDERAATPSIVSTLFPQLPRAELAAFRFALAVGLAFVIALTALRLFPIAVMAAALLVPLLAVLYLYSVDLYEDQPLLVLVLTMGWGAACGVGIALLGQGQGPETGVFADDSRVLVQGFLLPLLGLALAVLGPLALLPYRRFNDVLDGATFGALAAVSLVSMEAITHGISLLGAGVRPEGEIAAWIPRVAAIAVATPVLAMGAAGAALGSVWLRYRAPVADRRALGRFGWPPLALALAGVVVVLGSLGQPLLSVGWWLAVVAALAAVALVWLRLVVHVGLLQEAAEVEVGPAFACANCGAQTARHTFCSNCGVAVQALPKEPGAFTRGEAHGRLRDRGLVTAALVALAVLAGGAAAGAAVLETPAVEPDCPPDRPCGAPPKARPLKNLEEWRSRELGFRLEYSADLWRVEDEGPRHVELASEVADLGLVVRAERRGLGTPGDLLADEVGELEERVLSLTPDDDPEHEVLAPRLALRDAVRGVYAATVDTPQGVGAPLALVLLAGGDRDTAIVAGAVTSETGSDERFGALGLADSVLNSLRLASDPEAG